MDAITRTAVLIAGFEHMACEELRLRRQLGQITRQQEMNGIRAVKERRLQLPGAIRALLEEATA